ncbi:MAG: Sodium-dependent dicarboxylate transporter SdcS [Desulfovibrio sp.]
MNSVKKTGLFLGIACMFLILLLPDIPGLSPVGQKALALTVIMVVWWMTEAVPIWVTALLPLALSPLIGLAGVRATPEKINVWTNYSSPVVMLSLGVFLLAAVIEKWNLHRRIALTIVSWMGNRPSMIIFGFCLATGFVSMFMSNITAVAMMLPIGIALISQMNMSKESGFAKALVIGLAFAASIGGMGTMIGSGTNVGGVAIMKELTGLDITFLEWLKVGLPLVIFILPLSVFALCKLFRVNDTKLGEVDIIQQELKALGPMTREEKISFWTVTICILLFIVRGQISHFIPLLRDENLAIIIGVSLFLIPVDFKKGVFLMDPKTAIAKISWGTFLLLGGALTLGHIFQRAGLAEWLAGGMSFLQGLPEIALIIIVALLVAFISELCSNFVVASAFLPVAYGMAKSLGIDPMLLMMTVTLSASFAFMLPSGTPTNAIAFGSGYIDIPDMMKAGIVVKLIAVVVFPIVLYVIAKPLTNLF